MFMNDENKRHRQAIKIARETTNNQKKKYNSVKHLQRQQFSFMKTSIKVSLKILSLGVKLEPASRRGCLLFSKVNSTKQENRSKFSFYGQICNEIFFGTFSFYLWGANISEGFLKFCKLISNLILGQIIDSNYGYKVHKLAA